MRRTLYDDDHEAFRASVRTFVDKEIAPHVDEWSAAGITPRELFTAAGRQGFLGMEVPEEYDGGGVSDFRFNAVLGEELLRVPDAGAGLGIALHNDICLPYFLGYCTEEQKRRWLPGIVSGELVTAIGMTEPGIGSDLASMAPTERHRGMSLLVLERGMTGFTRGRNLDKLGQHAQDTAELFFDDVHVPVGNLLGPQEGQGFVQLVANLPRERLSIAVAAVASVRSVLEMTLTYVKERRAFGQPVGTFQNSRFVLAEIATELDVAQHYVDDCVRALNDGELTAVDAAKAKWWTTELQGRAIDRCLQLHGGYGFMNEYPVARAYADARVTRIYGGTTEIMKEVVGRDLGL
jgi:alkylation response protein AidB-like acyl-CoA dehydrogenase